MLALDHVAFGARDRASASEAMRALGFAVGPPCSCEWEAGGERQEAQATCSVLPDEYLDFIAISSPRWDAHLASSPVYRRDLAPTGIVLSGVEPATASRDVRADPYPIVRRMGVDPPAEIHYEFLSLAELGLPLGLVSDSSPDTLRRLSPPSHANGARGISRVHLRVPSIAEALASLARRPLSLPASAEIPIGRARLELHERPADPYLSRVLELLGETERPALLALELEVSSLAATAAVLRAHGVSFGSEPDALAVDPDQGFGTGIRFRG